MINIRSIKDNELEKVRDLIHTTVKRSYPSVYPPEVVDFFLQYHTPEQIKKRASIGIVLILEDENEIRATGFLCDGEIGGVYVHPDFQRRGYGKEIVARLLDCAIEQKCTYLHLDSTPLAKPLYLKMGFDLVGPATDWIGQVPLHYFKMEKKLG